MCALQSRAQALIFAYDRRKLRRLEFVAFIKRDDRPEIVVRFWNENEIDSLEHGFLRWNVVPGKAVFHFGFNCLGEGAWRQQNSWTCVEGTQHYMIGRDSHYREVRMCCLAVMTIPTRNYNFPALIGAALHMARGMRLFAERLPAARPVVNPALPDDAGDENFEIDWLLL